MSVESREAVEFGEVGLFVAVGSGPGEGAEEDEGREEESEDGEKGETDVFAGEAGEISTGYMTGFMKS